MNAFRDGVHFVSLATVFDPALVGASIAQTLGLRESGARTSAEALTDYLRDKRVLLILDNFDSRPMCLINKFPKQLERSEMLLNTLVVDGSVIVIIRDRLAILSLTLI